jgi:hypothetical protein
VRTLFSEVMKNMMRGVLFCAVAFATSVIYGGQEASGVYGVDVIVKERQKNFAVTDPNGNFVLAPLPVGAYTLSLRARRLEDLRHSTNDKVIVATSYLIKIEGTKNTITKSGLTSDKLLAGIDISVEVGPGAQVRGRVLPGEKKEWVWIPQRTGSRVPGHWAEKGSEEASAHNIRVLSAGDWVGIGKPQ